MAILILIGIGIVVVYPLYLGSELRKLSKEVAELRVGNHKKEVPEAHMAPPAVTEVSPAAAIVQTPEPAEKFIATPTYQSTEESEILQWLKKDLLVKLGALLLLIGFGWFVSYAFANNWIGPAGRITLGLLAGVLILVVGTWRIRMIKQQGAIFLVLGSSTVLLTLYAARYLYDFFTPVTALSMMFLSVAFVAFVSVRYKYFNLALASLLLAAVSPLLTAAPSPDVFGLFSYLLVVVMATLWIVYLTGWKELPFAALIIVALYGLPYFFGHLGTDKDIALFFAFIFTAVFFVSNVMSITHEKSGVIGQAHLMTALGTVVYLVAWVTASAPEEWRSLLYVAWMLVFSVGAYAVYRRTENRAPFYLYSGAGIALLAAATATEFKGQVLTIFYTIESLVILITAYRLLRNMDICTKLSLLFFAPVFLSFTSILSPAWNTGFIHSDFFVLLILMCSLFSVGLFFNRKGREDSDAQDFGIVFMIASALYALILIWLVIHAVVSPADNATMFSLIVYTIIGLVAYIRGSIDDIRPVWVSGSVLLGAVVVRLLLIEVWQMALTGRIITFFVIGTLLISTAFIGRRHKIKEEGSVVPNSSEI